MNRALFLIVVALLSVCVGYSQNLPNVDIKDFTLELKDDGYLNVDIDINLSELNVKTTQVVVLTPCIINGADTLKLKSVAVYGRNRRIFYQRNEQDKPTGAEDINLTPSDTRDVVTYNTSVVFMDWMDGCSLKLLRTDYGCCGNSDRVGESQLVDRFPLEKYIPESPLMNFAADALMEMAQLHSKERVDIAITNKGGLRSNIAAGTITFGDVYNVFTFENRLAYLTLNGEQLTQLCKEIAKVGGEAISGMRLEITREGELVSATVGGKAIEPQATYRIATLDYLSQGNDNLTTLAQGSNLEVTKLLLRDLMVEYIKEQTEKGIKISAKCDGRITIKE